MAKHPGEAGIRRSGCRTLRALACAGVALTVAAGGGARAQSAPSFTVAQADEGAAVYALQCATCHGSALEGGPFGPALRGASFQGRWGGAPLDELFGYMKSSMPPAAVGQLDDLTYAALLAHLLRANGVAAGDAALPTDRAALAGLTAPGAAVSAQARLREEGSGGRRRLPFPTPEPAADPRDGYRPVTQAMLSDPPAESWLSWRRGHAGVGYSPLDEIDRDTVGSLRLTWSLSLPPGPNTIEPLFHDGVLFVFGHNDTVYALNGATGAELWRYERALPDGVTAGPKRNMALWGETLIVGTSDVHVIALDIHTGRVVWDRAVGARPERISGGPLVANGVVMQGVSAINIPGGGHITGLDAETGAELWRLSTIGAPGDPAYDTWNGMPPEERSGGSIWTSGTYDADLDLAYFGPSPSYDTAPLRDPTDEPGVTNDALYTDATIAIRPRTGEIVWHYQHMPNDQWDMDWAFERSVIEMDVAGERRRLVLTGNKGGVFDAVDAATGDYLFSFETGGQNVITAIDPETGAKTIDPALLPGGRDEPVFICPSTTGGRNWMPNAWSAATGWLYVAAVEACMELTPEPDGAGGFLSTGVSPVYAPRPGGDSRLGLIQAIDVETGETMWRARQRAPQTTGVLATAGGLVFAGALDRSYSAYDAETGEELWRVGLTDVSNGAPITYAVDGKQYVAAIVGFGNAQTALFAPLVPEITLPVARTSAVFVFALPE